MWPYLEKTVIKSYELKLLMKSTKIQWQKNRLFLSRDNTNSLQDDNVEYPYNIKKLQIIEAGIR